MRSQSLLQLRPVTLHPAPDRCVIEIETALLQQLLDIAQRQRITKIPADRTKDESGFGLPPFEDRRSGYHCAILSHHPPNNPESCNTSLRRALNLAFEWGKLERPAKITLAKGERQRDTILSDVDWQRYIAECPQPWRDAAIIIRGTGMRPGEAFALRWENIYLNGTGGLIQVTEGKTKAARRMLPMIPTVYSALKARRELAGNPEGGWLFPASSREGHLNKDTAKDQHKRAIDRANAKAKSEGAKEMKFFQPYVLRHTALTQLAEAGCDVFTLARIAGHSSITITQRYVHPQADAIERAFQQTARGTPLSLPAGR